MEVCDDKGIGGLWDGGCVDDCVCCVGWLFDCSRIGYVIWELWDLWCLGFL